jgi:membrane protein
MAKPPSQLKQVRPVSLQIFRPHEESSHSQKMVDSLSVIGISRTLKHHFADSGSALLAAYRRLQRDDVSSLAAAVSYYMALSLFPLLLLLTGGLGLILKYSQLGSDAHQQILAIASEHCSPSLESKIRHVLEQFEDQSLANGPLGMLATLLAAISVFYQFERAFDKIWRIPPPPKQSYLSSLTSIIRARLSAFALLSGVGGVVLGVFLVNLAIAGLSRWISTFHAVGAILLSSFDSLITLALNAISFAILYRRLPKRPVPWTAAMRGGLLVAVIWEVGRQLLSTFIIGMRYSTAYGAIGSFISLLLWSYWSVLLILFGAEYVLVLSRRHVKQRNLLAPSTSDDPSPVRYRLIRNFARLKDSTQRPAA